jgi:hypothetical protein
MKLTPPHSIQPNGNCPELQKKKKKKKKENST